MTFSGMKTQRLTKVKVKDREVMYMTNFCKMYKISKLKVKYSST